MGKKQPHQDKSPTQLKNELDDIRNLSNQIMHLALSGLLRIDFLNEASKILMHFSGCDSVVMWLKERGKFYRSELLRSKKDTFCFEIMPGIEDNERGMIPELRNDTWLEKMSRDVYLGSYDPSQPHFTINGSFWSHDVLREKERKDTDGDYRSIILVPISVEKENIGLLNLKKKTRGFFKQADVEFYEGIAQTLSVALGYRQAQVELRERVKELMCLYGIAKIVEQDNLSLGQILQEIVKLLPPAWLYPDIASARIILDDQAYLTPHFQEGNTKQKADIIVGDSQRGVVELIYSEEKPELDEGPFLKEERALIDAIAREIALIIERIQTEVEKDQLQDQLRHADRLATIGQLSAGVAHELNEPIGSILGFAQLLQKNPDLPAHASKDIEKIMRASLHSREVIKKLMLFSRQMPPQKTTINLNQVIDESLYFLGSRCVKEGIKVVRQLSPDLPDVVADQAQMTQVLVNTVVNAIQSMPDGGQLSVRTGVSGECVSLTIEDTGVGMAKNIQRQMFQPFFTTKDVGKGTGLGLSVVYGIVTSHGGTISVDSKLGRGTKIEILLPYAERPAENGRV